MPTHHQKLAARELEEGLRRAWAEMSLEEQQLALKIRREIWANHPTRADFKETDETGNEGTKAV